MMSHFYMILPSNSSMQFYPNNTLTNYKTRLQIPIELAGDWEVALAEISFPLSWFTISSEFGKFTFSCNSPALGNGEPSRRNFELQVPAGYYKSVREITQQMNSLITRAMNKPYSVTLPNSMEVITYMPLDHTKWPQMKYIDPWRKVGVVLPPNSSLKVDKLLAVVLGWGVNPLTNDGVSSTLLTGTNASDLYGGIHNIYVYTDIVENLVVGDSRAPLLRIVEAEGDYGDVLYQSFEIPHYIPVRKKRFDTIELDIRDVFGEPLSFESGALVVTLHFRRASDPYFLQR